MTCSPTTEVWTSKPDMIKHGSTKGMLQGHFMIPGAFKQPPLKITKVDEYYYRKMPIIAILSNTNRYKCNEIGF